MTTTVRKLIHATGHDIENSCRSASLCSKEMSCTRQRTHGAPSSGAHVIVLVKTDLKTGTSISTSLRLPTRKRRVENTFTSLNHWIRKEKHVAGMTSRFRKEKHMAGMTPCFRKEKHMVGMILCFQKKKHVAGMAPCFRKEKHMVGITPCF